MSVRRCGGVDAAAGFTLMELLIAILLTTMVILGLAAVFSAVYQFHVAGYQKNILQGGASMSLSSMMRDIRSTSMFTSPNPPCPSGNCSFNTPGTCAGPGGPCDSDILLGCINLDGVLCSNSTLQVQRGDTSRNATAYQYCVDSNGNMWYTSAQATGWTCAGLSPCGPGASGVRSGDGRNCGLNCGSGSCCPAPVACGTALPGGSVPQKLATSVRKDSAGGFSYYFRRPVNENNLIELHYTIGSGTATITVNTSIPAAKTFNSPTP